MRDYLISVITPCHNVNMVLLERTFKTLKNQTLGFENIEWIVVIHNCVEENAVQIERLVEGYENIKTFRLQNDKNYAASPRNYGIDRATGAYLEFLDADDYVELDAFEVVQGYMQKTGAQVVVFRYEVLKESPDVTFEYRPLEFWDQTRKYIVGNHKSLDGSKFLHGKAFQIGSKVYSRSFLNENKFRFDERIPYAEESDFFMRCYGKADKLCFLPQYIGQIYCLYGDGMTAMMKKTPKVAINYAKGFKIIFDNGFGMKLYMNTFMWDILGLYSAMLIASTDMTYKDRKEVQRILSPYVKQLHPLQVSKVNTKSNIRLISNLVKTVLCHPLLVSVAIWVLKLLKIDVASRMDLKYDHELEG